MRKLLLNFGDTFGMQFVQLLASLMKFLKGTVSRDCNRPPFAKLSHNFDSTELFKIRLLSVDGTVSHKVVLKMLE